MSVGRSSKDQYSFQSLTSPHTGGEQLTANQKRLQPTSTEKKTREDYLPRNERQWMGIFYEDLEPSSTDSTHWSS